MAAQLGSGEVVPLGGRPRFARWLSTTNEITRNFLAAGRIPGLINMAGGLPAPEVFPAAAIAALARKAIEAQPEETLGYGPIEGLPELRHLLAERFKSPAVMLTSANVLITTSGMQGLDLIGKVLLDEEDLIAGQFPTYLGALDAWRPRRARVRPMRLDAVDFEPLSAFAGAKFAYTVPNFSNPTGKLVGLPQRQALVEAAHQSGLWLIEDDPYGGLSYDGPLPPSMLELSARAQPGRVYDGPLVYMGTLSKEISPGLRIGWIIAASALIEALTLAKQGSDMCTSGVTQRIALEAMQAGLIEEIRPRILALYRERREALCAAMAEQVSDWLDWEVPAGGMFLWARGRDPALDSDRLLSYALRAGVSVTPSSVFDPDGRYRRAIRVNFTLNDPKTLAEGVRRLAAALRAMQAESS